MWHHLWIPSIISRTNDFVLLYSSCTFLSISRKSFILYIYLSDFFFDKITNPFFFWIITDNLPESELLEMNDAETEQRPKDGQRVKGGGGIYAQGKEIFDFIY